MNWQPLEAAPQNGPQVLAAARFTKSVFYVWSSELTEKASNGELRYKAWAPIVHPDGVAASDERQQFEAAMGGALKQDQGEFAMSRVHIEGQPYTFLATRWAWAAWQRARGVPVVVAPSLDRRQIKQTLEAATRCLQRNDWGTAFDRVQDALALLDTAGVAEADKQSSCEQVLMSPPKE